MRYLSSLNKSRLRGKTVLLRVDFNIADGRETFRLFAVLPTIKFLRRCGAKVLILSHRGRPKIRNQKSEVRSQKYSLRIAVPYLRKQLNKKIVFFAHFDFPGIKAGVRKAPPGSIFLLENLRFLKGEEKNDVGLGRELAGLGDVFVNDAFSVCHRQNASITQLPKFLPAFAGLLLEKEISALNRLMRSYKKPLVVILGGAKAEDKIGVMENFLRKADCFLIGGVMSNTFLKARGFDIGKSIFEPKMLGIARRLLTNKKIILPVDFVSHGGRLLDIGPMSAKIFAEKITTAKTILWNGPMGLFEDKRFINGSAMIARAIVSAKADSVAGGGETTALLNQLGLAKKFGFVSTGGGAMLEYLSENKLPGIEALK